MMLNEYVLQSVASRVSYPVASLDFSGLKYEFKTKLVGDYYPEGFETMFVVSGLVGLPNGDSEMVEVTIANPEVYEALVQETFAALAQAATVS
jgi:hypothetical protein